MYVYIGPLTHHHHLQLYLIHPPVLSCEPSEAYDHYRHIVSVTRPYCALLFKNPIKCNASVRWRYAYTITAESEQANEPTSQRVGQLGQARKKLLWKNLQTHTTLHPKNK